MATTLGVTWRATGKTIRSGLTMTSKVFEAGETYSELLKIEADEAVSMRQEEVEASKQFKGIRQKMTVLSLQASLIEEIEEMEISEDMKNKLINELTGE